MSYNTNAVSMTENENKRKAQCPYRAEQMFGYSTIIVTKGFCEAQCLQDVRLEYHMTGILIYKSI